MAKLRNDDRLWTGYVFGLITFVACVGIAYFSGQNSSLQVLLCLLGGCSGWAAGIIASPLDDNEKSKFSDIAKGFLALGSGYVIGKLEDTIVRRIADMIEHEPGLLALRVLLFAVCLVVGFLFTLVTRLYGESEIARREERKARLLEQAAEINAKLASLL